MINQNMIPSVVLLLYICLGFTTTHLTQDRPSRQAEQHVYKQWYDAFKNRNLPQAIAIGEAYLDQFPDGERAGYLRETIEYARISLDEEKREQAKIMRDIVQSSIAKNASVLELLLKDVLDGRADVNTGSKDGQTALMYAAANARLEESDSLIGKGANIDTKEDTNGWTTLIYGIWSGDGKIVRRLLEKYADVRIKDKEGRTALDHAILSADIEMMLLIRSRPMRGVSG